MVITTKNSTVGSSQIQSDGILHILCPVVTIRQAHRHARLNRRDMLLLLLLLLLTPFEPLS